MQTAEKIIKDKQFKLRERDIRIIKDKCRPEVKFDQKAMYVDEKIENLQRSLKFNDM
jgi:hypothetical protein